MKHLLLSILAVATSLHGQTLTNVPTITGANVVTASDKVLLLDASTGQMSKVTFSELVNVPSLFGNVSATELGYLDGVTSSVQTQLDAKSPLAGSSSITTIGTLASGTVPVARITGLGTAATASATDFAKYRKYISGPNTGMRAFRSRLDRGMTAACLFVGDSTTSTWANLFTDALVARYPNHRVEYRLSNTSGTAATTTIKQAGTGRQYWRNPVGVTNSVYCGSPNFRTTLTGRYLSVEVEAAPNSDASLTSGSPTSGLGLCNAGSSIGLMFFSMSSSRKLEFYYYDADGFRSLVSTVACPALVVGTYVRYRVKLDTANGANRTADFHYSTDRGATWTFVQTVTAAKATNSDVVSNAASFGLGISNGQRTPGYNFSFAQCGVGANYEPILPERIDVFSVTSGAVANTMMLEGSPTCYVDVVGVNGASLRTDGWFITTLPTYAWDLVRDRNHDFCAINTSHNDVALLGYYLGIQMDALKTTISSRVPSAGGGPQFLHLTQNPETIDYYAALAASHNSRQGDIMTYSARKGCPVVDVYQAFLEDGRAVEDVLVSGVDGVHPTTAGYTLIKDTFWNSCFLDGTTE